MVNILNANELDRIGSSLSKGQFLYPKIVKIKLLETCNWRCSMCYCNKGSKAELTPEDWITIIQQLVSMGVKEIGFSGGEPMLYDGFEIILGALRELDPEHKIRLKLLTNATRLNSHRVKNYHSLGIYHYIVSLHGSCKEIHDPIAGIKNQWAKTVSGIRSLTAFNEHPKPIVWINCVVQRTNLFELEKMVELAASLGCNGINFNPIHTWDDHVSHQSVTYEEILLAQTTIFPKVREVASQLKIGLSPPDCQLFGTTEFEMRKAAKGEISLGHYETHPCYWPFFHITIAANGNVVPCCNYSHSPGYGNAREHSINELVRNKRATAFLEKIGEDPAQLPMCRGCAMKLQVNKSIDSELRRIDLATKDSLVEN